MVNSLENTEPILFNGVYYPYYPKIRQEDIGRNTSNLFVDTMQISNIYIGGMGADYDGDQVTVKGVYTDEANEELSEYMNSKQNFITFGADPSRDICSDIVQSVFAITKVLSTQKLTENISFN